MTQGIPSLSWDELRGVLAHELSHVKNRDVLIGSVAAAVALAITFAARMLMWGAILVAGTTTATRWRYCHDHPGPIAAMLSDGPEPESEYEADRTGVSSATGSLAGALGEARRVRRLIPANIAPEQAQLYIVNLLRGRRVQFAKLFSTHPPMDDRVRRPRQPSGRAASSLSLLGRCPSGQRNGL